ERRRCNDRARHGASCRDVPPDGDRPSQTRVFLERRFVACAHLAEVAHDHATDLLGAEPLGRAASAGDHRDFLFAARAPTATGAAAAGAAFSCPARAAAAFAATAAFAVAEAGVHRPRPEGDAFFAVFAAAACAGAFEREAAPG